MNAFLATNHTKITLAEILLKLQNSPEIEGIVTLGSTAAQTLNPSSDLDICVIWNGLTVKKSWNITPNYRPLC
jgi:predicted nucleotidyltransferase